MLKYWVWLSELKGLRNQTKLALLRRFGDPESIFYADPDELMLTEGADPGQLKLMENHDLAPAEETQTDDIEQRHEHEHDAPQIHGQLEQPRKAQVLLLGGIHHTASLGAHGTSGACR